MFVLDELSSLRSQSVEIEVFAIDISVFAKTHAECTGERVDEKVKELVLVDFTVCLLVVLGHTSANRLLN